MKNINLLIQKNNLLSFSNRELALLTGADRKKIWQFLKRLEKYGTVQAETKTRVVFWGVKDKENFSKELEKFLK